MLEEQRNRIDLIDRKIVKLMEERMRLVSEIAKIKAQNNLAILDNDREDEVLQKVAGFIEEPKYTSAIESLYRDLMKESRAFQAQQQAEN